MNTAEIARAVSKKGHKVEEHEVYKVIRNMLTKQWEHRQNETDSE